MSERKQVNASTACDVPEDIDEEGLWTDSFRLGKVLSLPLRILLSGLYGLHTVYLCIRGVPVNLQLKRKRKPIKVRME